MANIEYIAHSTNPEPKPLVKSILGHDYMDKWYRHYICGNSVAVYVNAAYDAVGSDHIKVLVHRWDIKTNKWIQMRSIDYLNGADHQSYLLNVNGNAPKTVTYSDNYNGIDSIHFCVSTLRIGWGLGRDKGSYIEGYVGNYNSMGYAEYTKYLKGNYIKCKKTVDSYHWHEQSDYMPNPFDTDWGNATSLRGSHILLSHKNSLVTF